MPAGGSGCDLLPGILNRLENERQRVGLRRRRPVAVGIASTSVLAIVAAGFLVGGRVPWSAWAHSGGAGLQNGGSVGVAKAEAGGTDAALERGLGWLLQAQEPSGGWSAARWGGQAAYDVGLSGLAILAILNAPPALGEHATGAAPSPRGALARGIAFLRGQQSSDGRFGPCFPGALYNHAIATMAMLEAFGRERDGALLDPIDRGLGFLCRSQSSDGGWGYLGCNSEPANTAMTCWPLQGLVLARGLGFSGLDAAIRGGLRHLSRVCDESGRLGYRRAGEFLHGPEALSSMGAYCLLLAKDTSVFPSASRSRLLDRVGFARPAPAGRNLYRDFFFLSALEALQPGGQRRLPREAIEALASEQVPSGRNRGSWEPATDAWSSAGGRLYSTAMATLILEIERRGKRLATWIGGED
jgi:hypothetical protein